MPNFYFTYGSKGQPFTGGWTKVIAPDMDAAVKTFETRHTCSPNGCLNCSSVYDEESFKKTMYKETGNLGASCHEILYCCENAVNFVNADTLRHVVCNVKLPDDENARRIAQSTLQSVIEEIQRLPIAKVSAVNISPLISGSRMTYLSDESNPEVYICPRCGSMQTIRDQTDLPVPEKHPCKICGLGETADP